MEHSRGDTCSPVSLFGQSIAKLSSAVFRLDPRAAMPSHLVILATTTVRSELLAISPHLIFLRLDILLGLRVLEVLDFAIRPLDSREPLRTFLADEVLDLCDVCVCALT